MRRGAAAIEQSCHRQHQRAGLDAADRRCRAARRGEAQRGEGASHASDTLKAATTTSASRTSSARERGIDGNWQAARGHDRAPVGAEEPPAKERAAGGAVRGAQRLDRRGKRQKRDVREHEDVDVERLGGGGQRWSCIAVFCLKRCVKCITALVGSGALFRLSDSAGRGPCRCPWIARSSSPAPSPARATRSARSGQGAGHAAADRRCGDRGGEGRRGDRAHPCPRPGDRQGRARPETLSRGRGAHPLLRHRRGAQPHRRHGRRPDARLGREAAAARRSRAPTWRARPSGSRMSPSCCRRSARSIAAR